MARFFAHLLSLALVLQLAAACSGGGGSSAIQGLEPPAQVSVVQPAEDPPASSVPPAAGVGDLPAGSDYFEDPASVYVYDPSIEPLKIVNEILCLLRQTAAHRLVNEGPYKAQINETVCQQGEGQNGQAGQSSGANAEEFSIWTVNSERASNQAPQFVQLWVPEEDGDSGPLTIFAELVLRGAVGELRPFGDFTLNFAAAEDESGVTMPFLGGTLATADVQAGLAGFQLFFRNGDLTQVPGPGEHAEETRATVEVSADGQSGNAKVLRGERFDFGSGDSGLVLENYRIAFDRTHFLRSRNSGPALAFKRQEVVENAWRYNLYDAVTGERIELQSGFGFRTLAGAYGWMGYWGMWLPEGVDVQSGDTVVRDVFGQGGESYTVFRAPGKLIRYARNQLDLSELEGQTFQWWYFDQGSGSGTSYLVIYDPLVTEWQKVGIYQPGSPEIDPIDPPQPIDTAALGFLNMWSDSLGGPTAYVDGQSFITYYAQEFVDGSDPVLAGGDLQLYGLVQCLRTGITAQEAEMGDVYLPDVPDVSMARSLLFQRDDLALYLDSGSGLEVVGLAPGEVPASGPYTWGLRSGPLVTSTAALVNPWDAWSADEFYIWETGPNPWNQFAGLIDAGGAFVDFDPPIRFRYVHATANDRNGASEYDGSTFFLSYGGPGQLWGLPQEEVDLTEDGEPDRWYPVVSLADGVALGPTATEYLVKALEIEQTLASDPAYSGSLDLTAAGQLVLPDETIYSAPHIGPEPLVEGPPRVIEGKVVGQDGAP